MAQYRIPDINMDKFEKKMAKLEKRCEKAGIDFYYDIVGYGIDEECIEGHKVKYPVTIVEVEGTFEGEYQFVAAIDHLSTGNIIRSYNQDITIPKKYYTMDAICEHCGTRRNRKHTYLVAKGDTLVQVGKSCMLDYTGYISAEDIAAYCSIYDTCETFCDGVARNHYVDIVFFMACVIAAVEKFGFHSSANYEKSTKCMALDFYEATLGYAMNRKDILEFMKDEEIYPEDYIEVAKEVIEWCKALDGSNDYLNNLRVAFSEEYFEYKYVGLAASAYTTYKNNAERMIREEREKKECHSEWIGEVGKTIDVDIDSWRFVTAANGFYGVTRLYEFITTEGNIVKWWTQKWIEEDTEIAGIRGRVKKFEEYKGRKYTVITYGRID